MRYQQPLPAFPLQAMTQPSLDAIMEDVGVPDLIEILAERLTPSELDVVLLEAHRRRVGQLSPQDLLEQYERDTRVRPSPRNASASLEIARAVVHASAPLFELLDLSPICPPGTIAVVAPVDPAAAWSVGGSNEVVSSCVGVLSLEAARRRRDPAIDSPVRLSASHRELHVPFTAPLRSAPHSRVFGLCTAGPERKGLQFETDTLHEHLQIHLRVLEHLRRTGYRIGVVSVVLLGPLEADFRHAVHQRVIEPLAAVFPDVRMVLNSSRVAGGGLYAPLSFTVAAEDDAEVEHQVGLGGLTDWTQQLLSRASERLLVSIIATERLGEGFTKAA